MAMNNLLGCNTLYPHGRLTDIKAQFTLEAQREALRNIRDAGFDGCEFSHYENLQEEECAALRTACEGLGLTPWSAHSWVQLPADAAALKERMPLLVQSLAGAATLGAKVMVVHAQNAPKGDLNKAARLKWETGIETGLLALAPYTITFGLEVAIENCGDRIELEMLVETVQALGLPGIGLNIDTGHAVLHGMTPAEAIGLMGPLLRTTHLQDNHGLQDEHLPPGRGTIDWPATLAALSQAKYKGMLMVEISDCPPGREPDAVKDTRDAYKNLHRFAAATAKAR